MKVWIDQYGDVVWLDYGDDNDDPWHPIWNSYLSDGCRLNLKDDDNSEMLNGLWMILE